VQLAREHEVGELAAARGRLGVLAARAVEIAVEDARVALGAEQDQGVGERLEPARYRRFDCLAALGVVVRDDSLTGQLSLLKET
jgi:hypothetical protein